MAMLKAKYNYESNNNLCSKIHINDMEVQFEYLLGYRMFQWLHWMGFISTFISYLYIAK
jgi:hypothetical protein